MAEPEKAPAENEDEEEVDVAPVVETADEKMDRIRAIKFPVIPELAEILQRVFPYFVRKGAKKKTELLEREVGPMLHALAFNPSEEQIEKLCENARYKEVQGTTRGHFEYSNFEQRVMEYLHYEPDAFKRHPKEKVLEALLIMCGGQAEVEAEEFKKILRTKGNVFTEDEAVKMLRVARDMDTGKVYLDEYATILAEDGLPKPPDPLEPCDEIYR